MYRDMPNFKPNEILVYLRRSRSDDPNMTLEEVLQMHETRLRNWIDRNVGEPVPEENFYREIISGETISERKEFQKLLKRIEDDRIRAVLCLECSRLSRGDMEDCGRIMKLFRWTHTFIIDEQQNRIYDLQEEYDREGFEREIKHGNYYLEYSKKLMKRGLDYVVANGGYVASIPPYGYRKIRVPWGKKKLPTLEIVEEEAKIVRLIFEWYTTENVGHRTIAERLNDMGVRPQKTQYWGPQSIKKILENEHYLGKIRYYAHKMDYEVNNLTVTKKKVAVKDYQLFDGLHDAIIDEETFNKVKMKRSTRPKAKKSTKLRNILASVLYCDCGYAMSYVIRNGKPRFECPEQRRCHNASIGVDELLNMISETLKQYIDDFSVELNSSNEDVIKKQEEKIAYLEKRLKDIEYKELSLWEKYTEENMPKSVFENLKTKYESEKKNTEISLEDALNNLPKRINYEERIASLYDAIDGLKDENVSAECKNNLVKSCIERISYKRQGQVRVAKENQQEGQIYKRGWTQSDPSIEVTLKV